MKRVKNFLRKIGKAYMKSYIEMYGPAFQCGIHPFSV